MGLKSLRNRTDIVIKPADKGGAVCVWDRTLYIKEGEKQLSDTRFYKKLEHDITSDIQKEIVKEIRDMIKNEQLPPSAENLIMKSPSCSIFYVLPKIHKEGIPGRPVVSNYSSPTYLISKFLSQLLRPIVEKTQSYIKDTTHLLKVLDISNFKMMVKENSFSPWMSKVYTQTFQTQTD